MYYQMVELGNTDIYNGTSKYAIVNPSFQGIGLDKYAYNQVISMLLASGNVTQQNFACPEAGTFCTYEGPCSDITLLDYAIFQF